MTDYATVGDTEFSDEDVAAYLAGETATKFAANPLSEILVQKYIAQTRDEQLETYNDMRRCNYVDGSYPVAMTNPKNTRLMLTVGHCACHTVQAMFSLTLT